MKSKLSLLSLSLAFGLIACGDTVENTTINQTGIDMVASVDDLPDCSKDNDGEQAYVKDEDAMRLCVDGKWKTVSSGESGADFSCKTEELKDKSGLKIVCNGDSIGVVLNGSDGKDGKQGKDGEDGVSGSGCTISESNDTAVVVVCGDSTMTIELNVGLPNDSAVADSERTAISLDSLAGYTQKGPFLKGSTVYLYELSDGRTLKQTNGNFTSKITSDDGHYKFTARDLVSQYAMVVVDGFYRNEVTGKKSDASLRLTALTDMRKRSSVNVNLLTHMEFDRVYNLVTRGDSTGKKLTVKKAKRQAQKEILKQFHIDLGDSTDAEDMDVFGTSDADAALLAVSVLLQGDSGTTDLSVLLTEISNDIAQFGEWKSKAGKAKLADWALKADADGRFAKFHNNVTGWGLGEAPNFAKFVRNYVGVENNLGVCGSEGVPVNRAVYIKNPDSRYFVNSYADTDEGNRYSMERFICKADTNGVLRWHAATNLEEDSLGWGHDFKEGAVKRGQINKDWVYVYDEGNWRYGNIMDDSLGLGCAQVRKDTVMRARDSKWYTCSYYSRTNNDAIHSWVEEGYEWREASDIEKDTAGWGHDYEEGTVQKGNVTDAFYVYMNGNWREASSEDVLIGFGCVQKYADTLVSVGPNSSDQKWFKCDIEEDGKKGFWIVLNENEANTIFWEKVRNGEKDTLGTLIEGPLAWVALGGTMVWDNDDLRGVTEQEKKFGRGCVSYIEGVKDTLDVTRSSYTCTQEGWVFDSVNVITDPRDNQTYKTIKMRYDMYWMAENLNYAYLKRTADLDSSSWCYDNNPANCETYGRLYLWSAAIDSTTLDSLFDFTCGNGKNCADIDEYQRRLQEGGRGLCPTGWHLPSSGEWHALFDEVGIYRAAKYLKSNGGWNENGNGTDSYGFSALPAGYRHDGNFGGVGDYAYFWSVSQSQSDDYLSVEGVILADYDSPTESSIRSFYAASVRCVRNY